jgi:putative transposase
MRIPAAGEDHKFTVFGALDYASGQLFCQISPAKNRETFAHFVATLAAAFPDEEVIVVLDNVGYHKSHRLREQWQQMSDRLTPLWLPAYAPQLNPIERVWLWLKEKLACHRWWMDTDRLIQATTTLLASIEVHFHSLDGPSFHLVQNFCRSA